MKEPGLYAGWVPGFGHQLLAVECAILRDKRAMPTQEDKDWERYKALKRGIQFFNWTKVGGIDEDTREIGVLEAKYPHFEAKWRKESSLRALPLLTFGGKRKRSRRAKRRHTRNATQHHRRLKA